MAFISYVKIAQWPNFEYEMRSTSLMAFISYMKIDRRSWVALESGYDQKIGTKSNWVDVEEDSKIKKQLDKTIQQILSRQKNLSGKYFCVYLY